MFLEKYVLQVKLPAPAYKAEHPTDLPVRRNYHILMF